MSIVIDIRDIENFYYKKNPKGHWFDKNTMIFFQSRLADTGVQVPQQDDPSDWEYLFISSEKQWGYGRLYSIRYLTSSGDIGTVGEFQEYETRSKARTALKNIIKTRTGIKNPIF